MPQNFDLRRRAGESFYIWLSYFENSQNLNVSPRSMILSYLRNCATTQLSVPAPASRACRGEEHARFDRLSASLLVVVLAGIPSIPPPA